MKMTEALYNDLNSSDSETFHQVVLLMEDRPDFELLRLETENLSRAEKKIYVWEYLNQLSENSTIELRNHIERQTQNDHSIYYERIPLCNGLLVRSTSDIILGLLNQSQIRGVVDDSEKMFCEPEISQKTVYETSETDNFGWGLSKINVRDVWQMGYSGAGILIAVMDTGINYNHQDISGNLWDGGEDFPLHGYDYYNRDNDPMDSAGHGSQIAGILAGTGSAGDTTGVAPGATLLILKVRENLSTGRVSDAWLAQGFAMAQGADIISMSLGWGSPQQSDRGIWRYMYESLKIAGIVCIKSAGNYGNDRTPPNSITVPGDVPSPSAIDPSTWEFSEGGLITVGSVAEVDTVMSYSSRGPVTWQDMPPWNDWLLNDSYSGLIKPDISAPGDATISISHTTNNGYASPVSGTSIAQPYVAGTVALMLEANPDLTPLEVDYILQQTALDLGIPGKDNDYGAGRLQTFQAVQESIELKHQKERERLQPSSIEIVGIYPNPFNSFTTITFAVERQGKAVVKIYDILGREVVSLYDGFLAVGYKNLKWSGIDDNGNAVGSGVYFVSVSGTQRSFRKIILIK
jgi:subtilisin family serine protease